MEEIISTTREEEMGEGNNIRLLELRLWILLKLKSIYRGVLFSDSQQSIQVLECPELKRLPIILVQNDNTLPQQLSTPALKEIRGSEHWWDSVEWDYPDDKTLLQLFLGDIHN